MPVASDNIAENDAEGEHLASNSPVVNGRGSLKRLRDEIEAKIKRKLNKKMKSIERCLENTPPEIHTYFSVKSYIELSIMGEEIIAELNEKVANLERQMLTLRADIQKRMDDHKLRFEEYIKNMSQE